LIILSFLGTGNYESTKYKTFTGIYEGNYFIEILNRTYCPEKIYIAVTKESKLKHSDQLSKILNFEELNIPSGKSEEEIWEMFELITDSIPEESELIIDVTHGFRSQPMIALAAAIYLRTVKNIKILDILYGAFDAKDDENVAPVFSLMLFLELIDWSKATDSLIKDNNAAYLKNLLTSIQSKTYTNNEDYKARGLFGIGKILNNILNSVSVVRPEEFIKYSNELPIIIDNVQKDIDNIAKIKPIKTILEILKNSFKNFYNQEENIYTNHGIILQSRLIEYCISSKQYQQAITLSRELLVTFLCKERNEDPSIKDSRSKIETELSEDSIRYQNKEKPEKIEIEVLKLWIEISEIRNDVNHAGMGRNAKPGNSIIENIVKLSKEIVNLVNNKYAYKPIQPPI